MQRCNYSQSAENRRSITCVIKMPRKSRDSHARLLPFYRDVLDASEATTATSRTRASHCLRQWCPTLLIARSLIHRPFYSTSARA